MKIVMAADHAGYGLKQHLLAWLGEQGHEVIDLGVDTDAVPADYPDVAAVLARALLDGRAERGILICGSGIGACIAANKFRGIYAAICHDHYSAHQGVEHDRMNVLCLGSRVIGTASAEEIADTFLKAVPGDAERFERRFQKLVAIEEGEAGSPPPALR